MLTRLGSSTESGIQEAQVNYRRLSSAHAEFEVIRTASDPLMSPKTNIYRVTFLSATSGWCNSITTDAMMGRFGTFDRMTNLVGQTVAPSSLQGVRRTPSICSSPPQAKYRVPCSWTRLPKER